MNPERVSTQAEIERVLSLVLAEPGARRGASRANTSAYANYLDHAKLQYAAYQVLDTAGRLRGATLALELPGRTTVLMLAPPGELGATVDGMQAVIDFALADQLPRNPHYFQSLVEPHAQAKRQVLSSAGFSFLTRLQYLAAAAERIAPSGPEATWESLERVGEAVFAEALGRTYVGSQDCPELRALRSEQDALASHQASGEFVPALWELCVQSGAIVGCLLCAPLAEAQALEVVYMGVAAECRGRGVGSQLLGRAAQHAQARGFSRLLLVVDERNSAARRIYSRHGFRCESLRDAYLLVPRS